MYDIRKQYDVLAADNSVGWGHNVCLVVQPTASMSSRSSIEAKAAHCFPATTIIFLQSVGNYRHFVTFV